MQFDDYTAAAARGRSRNRGSIRATAGCSIRSRPGSPAWQTGAPRYWCWHSSRTTIRCSRGCPAHRDHRRSRWPPRRRAVARSMSSVKAPANTAAAPAGAWRDASCACPIGAIGRRPRRDHGHVRDRDHLGSFRAVLRGSEDRCRGRDAARDRTTRAHFLPVHAPVSRRAGAPTLATRVTDGSVAKRSPPGAEIKHPPTPPW